MVKLKENGLADLPLFIASSLRLISCSESHTFENLVIKLKHLGLKIPGHYGRDLARTINSHSDLFPALQILLP